MTKESRFNAEKFLAQLNSKWVHGKVCPICLNNNWKVSPKPSQLLQFSGGSIVVGGQIMPVVAVSCTNCGHTLLFNPLIMGALDTPEE